MKKEIYYTLLSDGSSDRMLMPIITWALRQNLSKETLIQSDWADLYYAPRGLDLSGRINYGITKFPCDILFIHRDSEKSNKELFENRKLEIEKAWSRAIKNNEKHVPVVPIRMTEAWLLIDESAIREASGNPNGTIPVQLPEIATLESLPNPKKKLEELIRKASELKGRNLKKFNVSQAKHLVSEYIADFSSLKRLTAFQSFENDLSAVLKVLHFQN